MDCRFSDALNFGVWNVLCKSINLINMCKSIVSNFELKKIAQEELSSIDFSINYNQIISSKSNSYSTQIIKILTTINSKN